MAFKRSGVRLPLAPPSPASKMKQNPPGFGDNKVEAPARPKAHPLTTERAVSRAVEVFMQATRKAGRRARDTGVAVTGRIAGRKVRISPGGKITEICDHK